MARYEKFDFFSYQWSHEDEETNEGLQTIIRVYGFNERNESVYMRIEDFQIPLYLELPEDIEWNESKIRLVCNRLQSLNPRKSLQPKVLMYEEKHRSYYAYVEKIKNPGKEGIKYTKKKFPYLLSLFMSSKACDLFVSQLRKDIIITGMGRIKIKPHAYERTITPVLKLIGIRQLPSSGWMHCKGIKLKGTERESTRKHEYAVSFQDLIAHSEEESMKMPIVLPKVMSFDNEANSTYMSSMPKAERPGDKTFQIGYTMLYPATQGRPKKYKKVLLTLGKCDPIEDVTIKECRTEADLMVQLTKDMVEEDPEVVIGFNILGWDINYMIDRCKKHCRCLGEFDMMGCIEGRHSPEEKISWGSSAYGKQEFSYLNAEGRLFIDLLPYIKRNYKLPNYRLETICEEFLKTNKDPLKPKDIFKLYREFKPEGLATIGKYCVQDSYVTLLLYEKLLVWFDLSESAATNHVPMFDMFTKGQQIKMYAQVYSYCFHNDIVIESNAYVAKEDEHYKGAYVSEPIKGLYNRVVPFDFASLYPSIMRAYNIDYSKLVIDESIPDEDCHVMEWEEHEYCSSKGCPKDIFKGKKPPKLKDGTTKCICAKFKYRWLKHDVSGKGILPTLLESLLSARKRTRKIIAMNENDIKVFKKVLSRETMLKEYEEGWVERMKVYEEKKETVPAIEIVRSKCATITKTESGECATIRTDVELDEKERSVLKERIDALESLNTVLDRRQNAYKVNANSIYGACGAKKGYAPFLPAAMCVTFMGRTNILKVNDFVQSKYGAKVIYNDTDSAYCFFPDFEDKSVEELWAHAKMIVKEVKRIFPPELSLEFEDKIYKKFLILTKKRYVAQSMNQEGTVHSKLMKRGIVLQRRDNCKVLREVYQALIYMIFDHHTDLVKLKTLEDKRDVYTNPIVRKLLDMIVSAIDSVFRWSYVPGKDGTRLPHHIRDFVITKQVTRAANEYKNPNKLPSHVLLALKIQARGVPIGAGTRVEYVLTKNKSYKKTDTQKDKLVDIDYFLEFREVFRLSRLDYCKQFINPIDEICDVVMGIEGFVKQQWDQHIAYSKVTDRITELGRPKLLFEKVPLNNFVSFSDE